MKSTLANAENQLREEITRKKNRAAIILWSMTPWILMDFRSPRRVLSDIRDFYNRKDLISDRGEKKEAFYILQNFYNKLETK